MSLRSSLACLLPLLLASPAFAQETPAQAPTQPPAAPESPVGENPSEADEETSPAMPEPIDPGEPSTDETPAPEEGPVEAATTSNESNEIAPPPQETEPAPGEPEASIEEPTPEEEPKAPQESAFASDSRSGHIQVALGGALTLPFGQLAQDVSAFSRSGFGFTPSLDVAYGVSRYVAVGAYGSLSLHGGTNDCEGCSSSGLQAGAFVRYHLVQGLRFDPWISYGIGFRSLSVSPASGNSQNYSGLEWLRLQFGGDWYALPQLGFGPYLEFAAASFFQTPDEQKAGGVSLRAQVGLRVLFDWPGK